MAACSTRPASRYFLDTTTFNVSGRAKSAFVLGPRQRDRMVPLIRYFDRRRHHPLPAPVKMKWTPQARSMPIFARHRAWTGSR